jgi:hypothetical protein
MRHLPVTALVVAALAFAGCGEDVEPIPGADAPAITSPGTTIPFENGGADGSGADGTDATRDRGGVAAGHDSNEPGDQ